MEALPDPLRPPGRPLRLSSTRWGRCSAVLHRQLSHPTANITHVPSTHPKRDPQHTARLYLACRSVNSHNLTLSVPGRRNKLPGEPVGSWWRPPTCAMRSMRRQPKHRPHKLSFSALIFLPPTLVGLSPSWGAPVETQLGQDKLKVHIRLQVRFNAGHFARGGPL